MTYSQLLKEYELLYNKQSDEFKEAIHDNEKNETDIDIQFLLDHLSEKEAEYLTYSDC